jgi:hypothetical protein
MLLMAGHRSSTTSTPKSTATSRLYVFEMSSKSMRPFGMVTFDEAGRARPAKLPPVEE